MDVKLDLKLLIATAIAGFVGFLIDQVLYSTLSDTMARPVLIALLVLVIALLCCGVVWTVVALTDTTDDEFLFLDSRGRIAAGLAVCVVVLFLGTMLLEWIYDHDKAISNGSSSYIFILDESGSMEGNDPELLRYDAVESAVQALPTDASYAVYMFSDSCISIRDMLPASAGTVSRPASADETMGGMTEISNALQVVFQDLQSGKLQGCVNPQVILMTDGYATDMGWLRGNAILTDYKKAGIPVSTVGLGNVDKSLLEKIASKTGGQFVLVDHADELALGFTNATVRTGDRDLISPRNMSEGSTLYLFLRILFLTLIGAGVAFMKALACAGEGSMMLLIEGAIAALVAAIVMEAGLGLGLWQWLCRLLYWMALAVSPRTLVIRTLRSSGNQRVKTAQEMLNGGAGSRVQW